MHKIRLPATQQAFAITTPGRPQSGFPAFEEYGAVRFYSAAVIVAGWSLR